MNYVLGQDSADPSPPLARGIVMSEPNANDLIDVIVPAFSEQQMFNDIEYMPRGTEQPAPGATCLVAFDEGHAPWVPAWYGAFVSGTADNGNGTASSTNESPTSPSSSTNPEGATAGLLGDVKPDLGNGDFVAQTTRPDSVRVLPKKYLMEFLQLLAGRLGHTLYTNTFSRHPQFVSGTTDQSQHWTGNAADLHTTPPDDSALGDAICTNALELCAGVSTSTAVSLATTTTNYTHHPWKHNGLWYSVQILWRVTGHHDHVHVGIRRANKGEFPGYY